MMTQPFFSCLSASRFFLDDSSADLLYVSVLIKIYEKSQTREMENKRKTDERKREIEREGHVVTIHLFQFRHVEGK